MKADLTGGAVGEARLVVGCQVEIGRTGTLVPSAGRQQTQVAAASVCDLTLVFGNCRERPEGRSVNHGSPLRSSTRTGTEGADGRRTFGLAQGVVDLDGLDGLPGVEQLHPLGAGGLVGAPQRLGLAVGPVDKVLEQSQGHYPVNVIVGH